MSEKPQEQIGTQEWDFEAKQNLLGFLSVVLEVAKRNPELYKKIFNETYEDNGNTNHTNKS